MGKMLFSSRKKQRSTDLEPSLRNRALVLSLENDDQGIFPTDF